MKRRILSLLGLIGLAIVAYWVWNNLGGGQGLMRNVVRNTIIGALVPWALYLIWILLVVGGSKEEPSRESKEVPVRK